MICLATLAHLDEIAEIYAMAREFMQKNGNPNQWGTNDPPLSQIQDDIQKNQLYMYCQDKKIQCVFAYMLGDDPTYQVIDGTWLADVPYAAVHRVASRGELRGVAGKCISWSLEQVGSVRIDTHNDNIPMQRVLNRLGFTECGIIYLENGDARIAYQKILES